MNTWLNTFWIRLGLCIEHSKSLTEASMYIH
jgi:hypothetical protein